MMNSSKPILLEDLPDVRPLEMVKVRTPGDLESRSLTIADLRLRGKYLVVGLSVNSEARTLAAEYEMIFIEDEDGLALRGHIDSERSYMLECWRRPALRKIFEALDFNVIQPTGDENAEQH